MNPKLIQSIICWSSLLLLLLISSCQDSQNKVSDSSSDIKGEKADTLEEVGHSLLDQLTEKIIDDPNDTELYVERSKVHEKLLNSRSAVADMQRALLIDSVNADYWLRLSQLFLQEKSLLYAIDALRRGQEKNRDHIELNKELARAYLYSGDLVRSVRFANTALKLDITNPEVYFIKALAILERGDTLSAISNLQTATEQNPDYYDALIQLGILSQGRLDELVPGYYTNAIRIDSMNVDPRFALGTFYQNNNQPEKAKDVFRKLLLKNPMYQYAFYNIGYIYFQQDSLEKAYKNFDIASKVAPTYSNAYYMRGLTSEAMSKIDDAERDYYLTLKLDPDFVMARKGLERIGR